MFNVLAHSARTAIHQNARFAVGRAAITCTRAYSLIPKSMYPPAEETLQTRSEGWGFLSHTLNQMPSNPVVARTPEEVWQEREKAQVNNLPRPPDAYTGRSIPVQKDLGSAFGALQAVLRRNFVTYGLRMSERHEKKGVKRRRLSSERWRRRFAHEVRKKVQLVNEIRARGA